jgi:hypothetical protein
VINRHQSPYPEGSRCEWGDVPSLAQATAGFDDDIRHGQGHAHRIVYTPVAGEVWIWNIKSGHYRSYQMVRYGSWQPNAYPLVVLYPVIIISLTLHSCYLLVSGFRMMGNYCTIW